MATENYSFRKRQKELAKKKKQEEKRLNKLNKANQKSQSDSDPNIIDPTPII